MLNLVNELKRNAAYYGAGADWEAGDLLARAAEALSAPFVAIEALYTALTQAVYADLSASCGLSDATDIVKGRRPVPTGCHPVTIAAVKALDFAPPLSPQRKLPS
jgi:hypothetical protein